MTKKSKARLERDLANAPIQEEHIARKEFNYAKNGVKLNFTLRTDIKLEMETFKELMGQAIQTIDIELAKLNINADKIN